MKQKGKTENKIYNILIVVISAINILIIGFSIAIWIGSAQQHLFLSADFTNLYTTFMIVKNGDGEKLYELGVIADYQNKILDGRTIEGGVLPILYPPIFSLLLSPFSLLPLNSAYYLWAVIQLGLLIWVIRILNLLFLGWNKTERLILILTLLAFWPLAITFLLGQVSLFILLCFCQIYISIKNNKFSKAGLFFSLLMIKPQTILIPGMMILNKRYWRIALAAIIIFSVLVIFSSVFLGFTIWGQYARLLPTMSNYFGEYGFYPAGQYTLRGMLSNILGYSNGNLINILNNIVLFVVLIIVWYINRHGIPADSLRFNINFSVTIVLSAFLSMHLYPHDDLILILPAAIFYDYLRQNNYPIKAYSLFILISPMIFLIAAFNHSNIFGVIRPPIIVIIILLIWMIYYMVLDYRIDHKNIDTLSTLS
jgi:hypothetical protein